MTFISARKRLISLCKILSDPVFRFPSFPSSIVSSEYSQAFAFGPLFSALHSCRVFCFVLLGM